MRIFISVLSLFILFSCSVNNDNDVIFTYNGGVIKWRDIKNQAIEFKRMHPDSQDNIEVFKKNIIDSIIIHKIMAIEAKKSHKNDPIVKKKINEIKENILIDILKENIYKTITFKKTAYKIFFVGVKKAKSSNALIKDNNVKQLATEILNRIKNIRNTSQCNSILNSYKAKSDFIVTKGIKDYFTKEEATDNIYSAVLNLKKGKYFENPVQIANGNYLIIYLMDKKIITNKNINKIIKKLKTKEQILSFERRKILQEYISNLKSKIKIIKHYENIDGKDEEILLEIKPNVTITVAQFKYKFSQTFIPDNLKKDYIYYPDTPSIPSYVSKNERIYFIETFILHNALLYNEALSQKLDKTQSFKNQFEKRVDNLYESIFRYDFGKNDFNPTEKQMREYYKSNSMTVPFERIKEQLRYTLYSQNYSKNLTKWKEEKIKEYNIKFVKKNFRL